MRKSSLLLASALTAPAIIHNAAYANSLTRLIPDLYAGLDVVSRELVGLIPSVFRNASAERAAVGQAVVYPITPEMGMFDVTPSNIVPNPADVTIGNGTIEITKSKGVEFGWTGEEQRGLNTGAGYLSIQADLFAQGLRTLTNAIELDLAVEGALKATRAYGTPGTTPFATNVGDSAQVRKILDDNGAPASGRSLVGDTSMGAALRTLANLTKANEAGTTMTLRDGELLNLNGLSIKESAQIQNPAIGTGSAYTTNTAGHSIGTTAIPIITGTGTVLAGDVVTFAGDDNKYVVATGVAAPGTIHLAKPGLREAIPAAATAMTIVGQGVRNLAFSRNALHLVARAPALPQEGDAAIDRIMITDPRSGMVFEVALYALYRKIRAEVTCAWGVKGVKPEHLAVLYG